MRLACLLLAVLGCSSSPKSDATTPPTTETTSTASSETSTETARPAGGGDPTSATPPATQTQTPGATSSTTTSPGPVTSPGKTATASATADKPLYSCFSYVTPASRVKKHNCMKTEDCPTYVEQAKAIKGIRDLTGCASVTTVWCFHQLVKGDPEGVDVCQQTADECKVARTAAVKAKENVDTDCAQR